MNTLNTRHIRILKSIADKKSPNHALRGVYFDSKNNAVVSTDTRRMIAINVEHNSEGIVGIDTINSVEKFGTFRRVEGISIESIRRGGSKKDIIMFGKEGSNDPKIGSEVMDLMYPDWTRVYCDLKSLKKKYKGEYKKFNTNGDIIHIDILMHGVPVNPVYFSEINKLYQHEKLTVYYVDKTIPPLVIHNDFAFTVMPMTLDK